MKKQRRHYAYLQYHSQEYVTAALADASRAFQGDLQKALILSIIGQAFLRTFLRSSRDPYNLGTDDYYITASRISDITYIPRETVRRKLNELFNDGLIKKDPMSRWTLTFDADGEAIARQRYKDVDDNNIARLSKLCHTIRAKI